MKKSVTIGIVFLLSLTLTSAGWFDWLTPTGNAVEGKIVNVLDVDVPNIATIDGEVHIICEADQMTNSLEPFIDLNSPFSFVRFQDDEITSEGTYKAKFLYYVDPSFEGRQEISCYLNGGRTDTDLNLEVEKYPRTYILSKNFTFEKNGPIPIIKQDSPLRQGVTLANPGKVNLTWEIARQPETYIWELIRTNEAFPPTAFNGPANRREIDLSVYPAGEYTARLTTFFAGSEPSQASFSFNINLHEQVDDFSFPDYAVTDVSLNGEVITFTWTDPRDYSGEVYEDVIYMHVKDEEENGPTVILIPSDESISSYGTKSHAYSFNINEIPFDLLAYIPDAEQNYPIVDYLEEGKAYSVYYGTIIKNESALGGITIVESESFPFLYSNPASSAGKATSDIAAELEVSAKTAKETKTITQQVASTVCKGIYFWSEELRSQCN